MDEPERPDPDRLLAQVSAAEARARRGTLKVWLGAAPGVGKTFAMLAQAHRLRAQGVDVVVGVVETHGRAETRRQLDGLEQLPRRTVDYRGTTLHEFDLDAALRRRPAAVLVDELAHTNAPGSRFEKRWQDVRALLDAGIGVLTTLNVQHVESLNDVVARATGVTVRETVPDEVLADATEVELVDLPPDALLERLHAGKVYIPAAAQAAAQSFFKKGNLAALRELALRKTAQLVDRRRRADRQSTGERRLRSAAERVLVCVGPSPFSANLVRAAHRMTAVVRGDLFAVSVSPPGGAGTSAAARERILQHLRLAESLGASTASLEHEDAAAAILEFAERHDCSRIVVGKTRRRRWQDALFGSFTMEVIRNSRGLDVYVIDGEGESDATAALPDRSPEPAQHGPTARDFAVAIGCTAVAVALALLAFEPPDLSTEALLLVLGVVAAARTGGRWPSLLAALFGALAFNFLLIEPRFTFDIAEPAYMLAFAAMAVVGVSVATLVAAVRERAAAAQAREADVATLLSLTRALADAADTDAIGRATLAHLRDVVRGDLAMFVVPPGAPIDLGGLVATHGATDWLDDGVLAVARWCRDHGKPAGAGTGELPGTHALFIPLRSPRGKEGVLGLHVGSGGGPTTSQRRLLDSIADQAAGACERLALAAERVRAQREVETERLRSTLLASVSHDLRTPLTTITAAASRLVHDRVELGAAVRTELAETILAQANRLNDLIANLLFATRLEAGAVALRRQWTSLAEIVGTALSRAQLQQHQVDVQVPNDLPLLDADPVLLEQALFNLLDNTACHTPPGTRVVVRAAVLDGELAVDVADDGPGIPPDQRDAVFQRFVRGRHSAGMGLGLAICAGIVQAHGGRVHVEPVEPHGARFRLRLPLPAAQPRLPAPEDSA
ncbi:MAG: sensor histidine kinase KdpD [Planctomycetes bacterium]|nr:sensor histidine kinase KdpD [Planctomycetota bacterium]